MKRHTWEAWRLFIVRMSKVCSIILGKDNMILMISVPERIAWILKDGRPLNVMVNLSPSLNLRKVDVGREYSLGYEHTMTASSGYQVCCIL